VLGDDPVLANTVKLVCNLLIASVIESLGEGLALAEGSGIPARQCLDVLTETPFSAPIYKIGKRPFEPAGLPLCFRHPPLALAAAESVLVPVPIASLVRDHMLAALARAAKHKLDWFFFVRDMPRTGPQPLPSHERWPGEPRPAPTRCPVPPFLGPLGRPPAAGTYVGGSGDTTCM
jgi:hypothetical protein